MKSPSRAVPALAILALGIAANGGVFADVPRGPARMDVHARPPVVVRAHGGAVRFGLFVSTPLVLSSGYWGPHHYYPSPYYSPYYSAYYAPVSPPMYVEQEPVNAPVAQAPATVPEPQSSYWYYCGSSRAYYSYVRECPGGWQRISPQPPPA